LRFTMLAASNGDNAKEASQSNLERAVTTGAGFAGKFCLYLPARFACLMKQRRHAVLNEKEQPMIVKGIANFLLPSTLVLGLVILFTGCESKGPAEQAGQQIDKGIQNAKDAVNPPGPLEKAGRAVDNATKQ
jgi:hypothetical protein